MFLRSGLRHALKGTVVLAACLTSTALAGEQLKVYLDPDGDGTFEKVASYDVTFAAALKSFAEAGGAPWDGTGTVLSGDEVDGVAFDGPQSWQGFLDFLASNYATQVTGQLCDDAVFVVPGSIRWRCDRLACRPEDRCTGHFRKGTAKFQCVPGGVPPCPQEKAFCGPIARKLKLKAFDTNGGTACQCNGFGNCVKGTGTPNGQGIIFTNDVCQCMQG